MKYIVLFRYKAGVTQQAISPFISAEKVVMSTLVQQGLLEQVYLSTDLQQGWLVFTSDDEQEVKTVLEGFPLYPFWITELVAINAIY